MIPHELKDLSYLNLGNNSLWGPIPVGIGSLPMLQILVLQDNHLTGTVPPDTFNNSALKVLSLVSNNNLTGTIPGNGSFSLPMLQFLSLS